MSKMPRQSVIENSAGSIQIYDLFLLLFQKHWKSEQIALSRFWRLVFKGSSATLLDLVVLYMPVSAQKNYKD